MDPQQVERDSDGVMRCQQCGFAYTLSPPEIIARAGSGLDGVVAAVQSTDASLRHRRPSPNVWSVNAYTSHLADAADVITWRVRAIAETDAPLLPNHDQDRAVEDGLADRHPAGDSLKRLEETVRAFQRYVLALEPGALHRVGRHSIAGEVRLSDIAHDMPHELTHHAQDIRTVGDLVRRQSEEAP
ncbi:MAG: hypothetical protein NVS2B16_25840 [Chloroflexota bacterium]